MQEALGIHLLVLLDAQQLEVFLKKGKVLHLQLYLLDEHFTRERKAHLEREQLVFLFLLGILLVRFAFRLSPELALDLFFGFFVKRGN